MSRENLQIVSRFYSATSEGNFWMPELFHPDVRVEWLDGVGIEKETAGLVDMSETLKVWLGSYDHVTLTAEQIVEAGDQVVAIATWHARGRASGAATEMRHGSVWTFANGKISGLTSYSEPRRAFEACGLGAEGR